MNKDVKYYYGVYKDYSAGTKIAQLCLTVDDLSCEILANPGCLTFHHASRKRAIAHAKLFAEVYGCTLLELNLEKYRAVKIK